MRIALAAYCWLLLSAVVAAGCFLTGSKEGKSLKKAPTGMHVDFTSEVRRRGIAREFDEYRSSLSSKLRETRANAKCRLPWVEQLLRDPLRASTHAEQFTRQLYIASAETELHSILNLISEKLSIQQNPPSQSPKRKKDDFNLQDPLKFLSATISETRQSLDRAYQSLTPVERSELRETIYPTTTSEATEGYHYGGDDRGKRVIELLLRVNLSEVLNAAHVLAKLADSRFIQSLNDLYRPETNRAVLRKMPSSNCVILIGGHGPNVYDLDQSQEVCAVVDFGGDDIYQDGSVTLERPVLVILDLGGNDVYRGSHAGVQGASIMGASFLLDLAGNDTYRSADVSQGSTLSGVGILIDEAGNDSYVGDRRVQGQAIHGVGILIDRGGVDHYHASLFAQGSGGPLGAGVLIDRSGDDHYFAGGKYPDSYSDSPGFGSWSQGMGSGARNVANGGIGVLLDGAGNDLYEADYFSHGGGYWFGAGFARDFDGNDRRIGAVRTNFDGSTRVEKRYLRWGTGFGCHYAAGFVFDDLGDDSYNGNWASIGYGWDSGVGVVFDGEGNDRYDSKGSGVAEARKGGFAILYDLKGKDDYAGSGLGQAENKGAETPFMSFAFLQDRAGYDTFSRPLRNRSKAERGWAGGIFIDR